MELPPSLEKVPAVNIGQVLARWLIIGGVVALLLAALHYKDRLLILPQPWHVSDGFSAERAAARLARILGDERPHPVDSAANDTVRERLIAELRALGLQPRVADDFACNSFSRTRSIACARVRNVVTTLPGGTGPHMLLSAHYDSTFAGPGAADAGIGVATLLEVADRLRGQPLARPVALLFNEGEEMGLIGARAFTARDPLAAQVGAVLNFEARGVTGPAVMFETSLPAAPAIRWFARHAPQPVANSLSTDLYRLIPNSTDVTVFAEDRPRWTILNFAVMGNETRYHSAGDTLAALDRRSLQHMGDQALALARAWAAGDAPASGEGDLLHADLLGRQLVVLPLLPGLGLLGLLLVFFAFETWRRGALKRPLAAIAVALIGAAALAWLGQFAYGFVRAGDYWRGHPEITELAIYASAMAAALAALRLIPRNPDPRCLRPPFWLLLTASGAALALVAPGGAIFFLAGPLIAALGLLLGRWFQAVERVAVLIAGLVQFLAFAPNLGLMEELLNNGPHWLFAPLGASLALPFLIELQSVLDGAKRRRVGIASALLFAGGWAWVQMTPAYSEDRQQAFAIEHVTDATGSGPARNLWSIVNDGAPVDFPANWQRETLAWSSRPRWTASAPAIDGRPPRFEPVTRTRAGEATRVQLRLRMEGAEAVTLLAPPEAPLVAAGVPGFVQRFQAGDSRFVFRCIGRSCDGALIDLFLARDGPIEFTIIGTASGLPEEATPLVWSRPRLARPQYAPDQSLRVASWRLAP